MIYKGNLHKMRTEFASPVKYFLSLEGQELFLNEALGKELQIEYLGEINCIKCGRKTNKSFSQGFCYPCFISAPETEECVLRPELCKAHEGIARDMEYAQAHCLIDQFVYLSLTSGIKVGVTRSTQIPTRWIDQGAIQAIKLAKTPNRHIAGLIEVALKEKLADKTNWQKMLTGNITEQRSLADVKKLVIDSLDEEFEAYIDWDNEVTELDYPVQTSPQKVVSLNLDKTPVVGGILTGIKGQYMNFDNRAVINIRKYGGYKVKIEVRD
jgi:hypothetical protein